MAFEPQALIRLDDIILFITDQLENVCDNVGKEFNDTDFADINAISIQLSATGIKTGKLHKPRYKKHSGTAEYFNQYLEQYGIDISERYIIKTEVQYLLQTAFTSVGLVVHNTVLTDVDQLYFISQTISQFIQKHIKICSATYFNKKAVLFFKEEQTPSYVLSHFLAGSLFPINFNFLDGQTDVEQKDQIYKYFESLVSEVILQCDIETTNYRAFITTEYIDHDPDVDSWEDTFPPPDDGDKDKPEGWQPGDPIPIPEE